MEKHKNFIGGTWQDPLSQQWIEGVNPANQEVVGLYPRSSQADIEAAARAAREAWDDWRKTPAPVRAEFLVKAADSLKASQATFALQLCEEMGKPLAECEGDVQEAIDMALFCAGEGRRNLGMVTSSEIPNRTVMAFRQPIGVAGAITPWNFPMAMPAWKIMPALIAGNTVILKPAKDTPQSAINLARAFEDAGLPAGVLNVVMGLGEEAGEALVMQDGVDVISFTGSTVVGTRIAEKCPSQAKRVALEMGGKNVIIVLDDADLELAVAGIVRAVFGMAGQRCTSAGRIVVDEKLAEPLTAKLVESAAELKLGNGLEPDTEMGPVINETQLSEVHQDVTQAIADGATLLCGGERAEEGDLANGFFYRPTLLAGVATDAEIAQKEVFGPVAVILPARGIPGALAIANDAKYGLSAAAYTRDLDRALYFAQEVRAGAFFVNTPCIGAEIHLPFGGFKGSGNGRREGAHHMLDIYTEWKTVAIQQADPTAPR